MVTDNPSTEGLPERFAQLAVLFGHLAVEARREPTGEELLPVLAALADVEGETDALMATVVSRMRVDAVTWEKIAEVVGISTTVAWRRWRNVYPAAPRPTGQVRPRRAALGRDGRKDGDFGL